MDEAVGGVDARAIPPKERGYREGMPEVVHPGRPNTLGQIDGHGGHKMVKSLTDSARVNGHVGGEGEDRGVRSERSAIGLTLLKESGKPFRQAWSHGNEPTLGELGMADDE